VSPGKPNADETARVVTPPQAPPLPAAIAKADVVDPKAATALASDHLSTSLIYGRSRGNRALLLVAGIATASIVVIAIAVFASRGHHDDTPPALPPTIAEVKPAVDEPTTATTPVEQPKPPPVEEPKPPPVEAPKPPVVDKPPVRPPVMHPRPTPPVTPHAAVQPPPIDTPKPPVETPRPPINPTETPSLTLEQKIVVEKQALASLYQRVGVEIAQLRKAKGDAAANDANNAYRRIQIMTAYATSTSRAETTSKLNSIHAQIAAAMQ
jgi:hypothetical protein